jgi:hypothetical protein
MRIWFTCQGLIDTIIELVGIKSGLALTEGRLIKILNKNYDNSDAPFVLGGATKWWLGDRTGNLSLRGEELEADFLLVMHQVGALSEGKYPSQLVYEFVKKNISTLRADNLDSFSISQWANYLIFRISVLDLPGYPLPDEFQALNGIDDLIDEYRRRYILYTGMPQRREWDGRLSLNDLFESEEVPKYTTPNHYFDQRYIDYLNIQSNDLEQIHWRQFEYLTAEYFRQNGYAINITLGRADGGRDVIVEKKQTYLVLT